jgi:hypothetical protein
MTTNRYRVPEHTWRQWNAEGQRIFNEMYMLFSDQKSVNHPNAAEIPANHWKTIRWNAAWAAADFATTKTTAKDIQQAELVDD